MACILKPKCNFLYGYFRCLLPIETMELEVKVKMMRGIHTFRRDHTIHIISCSPWSTRLHPYPSLIRKMKTYLELESKLGTQPQLCTSTYLLDNNSLLWKTPVPNKAEKKKRAKTPIKRRFKVRLIEQSLPLNPTLPINPTTTAVTTTVTSTQMSAVKPTATTANPTPIPVIVYNLAQSKIQEIHNPQIRKYQGEEGHFTPNGDNPSEAQQPDATTTVTAPQTRVDTPWPNTMPASINLFVARASWPIPPSETSTLIFVKMEKAEERTLPKIAIIPHVMVNKPPQNKAEEMCGWGLHCIVCAKSIPNPKAESSADWNGNRQDQLERNYYSPSPQYSPAYDILDRFSQHYKSEKDRKERLEFLNDKYNLDYYSSSDSDSESEHIYETLI